MRKCGMLFDALVDYQEGRADEATAELVRTHLAMGCDTCQGHLARLGRILATLPEAQRLHAPQSALERAQGLFRERRRKPETVPLRARLVFDSRAGLALAGARGGESQSLQLLYETDAHDVDLWQEKAEGEHWYLIGQIFPKSGGDPLVIEEANLVPVEGSPLAASVAGTEFHLPSVLPGVYELRLRLADGEIVVPDVLLGHREKP